MLQHITVNSHSHGISVCGEGRHLKCNWFFYESNNEKCDGADLNPSDVASLTVALTDTADFWTRWQSSLHCKSALS